MSAPVIAIDAMGGDFGPHCVVPACLDGLAEHPSLRLILVGQPSVIEALVAAHPAVDRSRLRIHPASEVVAMDERPAQVLRGKPDSSMRQALELVRRGEAQACVSAGNTGALMALSRYLLKTLPGIDRPAMVTAIPTARGSCHLLDLGANIDCSAEHLYQFAVMGAVAAEARKVFYDDRIDLVLFHCFTYFFNPVPVEVHAADIVIKGFAGDGESVFLSISGNDAALIGQGIEFFVLIP